MKKITSTQNEQIKNIVKLHTKSHRYQEQQCIAEGKKVIETLLEGGYQLLELFITEEHLSDNLPESPATVVSQEVMKKISTASTPCGILGLFKLPDTKTMEVSENSVVFHNIQDPGNLGTLIRTAAAMAIKNVFLIEGTDPFSPKTIQSTAGTIAWVNIIQTDWQTFSKTYKDFQTCALVPKNGINPDDLELSKQIFIVGNESQGLPEEIIASCYGKMTLPMPGKIESLNAAVAGAIALFLKSRI